MYPDAASGIMCAYSGTAVRPLSPDPSTLRIEDIAHALAAQPRFAGHTDAFYSVAQHSLWVSEHVPEDWALAGLLHDAPRVFLMDLLGPHKRDLPEYGAAERRLLHSVHEAFGLDPFAAGSRLVSAVDDLALLVEWRDLKESTLRWWGIDPAAVSACARLRPMSTRDAEQAFLERFHALTRPTRKPAVGDGHGYRRFRAAVEALNGWRAPSRPQIVTISGAVVDPLRPDPSSIRVKDIAWAQSRIPRFAGHTREVYTVGEHSLFVAEHCAPEDSAYGLVHDGSEGYLLDMPTPVKRFFPGYRRSEHNLQRCIHARFGLDPDRLKPQSVHDADHLALRVECRDMLNASQGWWMPDAGSIAHIPTLVSSVAQHVYEALIERYHELLPCTRPTAVAMGL